MDKNLIIKKFQIAIGILAASLVIFILLIVKTVPVIQNIFSVQEQYKTQSSTLADLERQIDMLNKQLAKKQEEEAQIPKQFFKPIETGLDTEAVISDEFGEILQLIRENKIKTRSVKYDYDPQDDNFVKNAANSYHVCRVSAEMVASYTEFENFLRDLYKHEHFLEVSNIEIVPYQKNKKILLISIQFKLYAQRDGSSPAPKPAAQPAPAAK